MFCSRNVGAVRAVEEQHPKMFTVDVRPATEHRSELEGHGIASHGVVCLGPDGKTLWKHGDHQLSEADLAKGVEQVLAALR